MDTRTEKERINQFLSAIGIRADRDIFTSRRILILQGQEIEDLAEMLEHYREMLEKNNKAEPDEKVTVKGCLVKYNTPFYDGTIIKKGAFRDDNGKTIPIVTNFEFTDPCSVVGSATLNHQNDGVYFEAVLNQTDKAKEIVKALKTNRDDIMVGAYATNLTEKRSVKSERRRITHGIIRGGSFTNKTDDSAFIEDVTFTNFTKADMEKEEL